MAGTWFLSEVRFQGPTISSPCNSGVARANAERKRMVGFMSSLDRHTLYLFDVRHVLVHGIVSGLEPLHFIGVRISHVVLLGRIILQIIKLHSCRCVAGLHAGV